MGAKDVQMKESSKTPTRSTEDTQRRMASWLTKAAEYDGYRGYEDASFRRGGASGYPEIPGEEARNVELDRIGEQWKSGVLSAPRMQNTSDEDIEMPRSENRNKSARTDGSKYPENADVSTAVSKLSLSEFRTQRPRLYWPNGGKESKLVEKSEVVTFSPGEGIHFGTPRAHTVKSIVYSLPLHAADGREDFVALKLVPCDWEPSSAEFASTVRREYQVLAGLDHPHIIATVGSLVEGSPGQRAYGLLLYPMAPSSLAELLEAMSHINSTRSNPGASVLLDYMPCLCRAVSYLHRLEQPVKHRDINPTNILIDKEGSVILADFDIAQKYTGWAQSGAASQYNLQYASKSVRDGLERSFDVDVFSLGCVFLEMVTVAFGETLQSLRTHLSGHPGIRVTYAAALESGKVSTWLDHLKTIAADSPDRFPLNNAQVLRATEIPQRSKAVELLLHHILRMLNVDSQSFYGSLEAAWECFSKLAASDCSHCHPAAHASHQTGSSAREAVVPSQANDSASETITTPTASEISPQRSPAEVEMPLPTAADSFHDSGIGSSLQSSNKAEVVTQDTTDMASIRTSGDSIPLNSDLKRGLVEHFVRRLMSRTKHSLLLEAQSVEISDLLLAFTVIAQVDGMSKLELLATKFIRMQRMNAANSYQESIHAALPLEPSLSIGSVRRIELLAAAFAHDSIATGTEIPQPEYLDTEHRSDADSSQMELPEELLSIDDPTRKAVEEGISFLLNSTAFQWLVTQLTHLTSCMSTGPTYMSLRGTVARCIENASPKSDVTLALCWDVIAFLTSQYSQQYRDLSRSVVFCGSIETPYACTAREYLRYLWPDVCDMIFAAILQAHNSTARVAEISVEHITLVLKLESGMTTCRIVGDRRSVLEITEAMIWLATACRAYDSGDCMACSTPQLSEVESHDGSSYDLIMSATLTPLSSTQLSALGTCWIASVYNPVIALGYPVPPRTDSLHEKGLEASLDLIVALSRAHWATSFNGKFFLKGSTSALVPSWESTSIVVWHIITSDDPDERMTHNRAFAAAMTSTITATEVITYPTRRRHFVGIWTPSARVTAGSRDKTLYDIHQSQSDAIDQTTVTLTNFGINGGKYAGASLNFVLGKKERPLRSRDVDDYEFRLIKAAKMPVLFYGEWDKRAWLLDVPSALLHLSNAWLTNQGLYDKLSELNLDEVRAGSPDAKAVLLRNRSLGIHTRYEGRKSELTLSHERSASSSDPNSDPTYFSGGSETSEKVKQEHKVTVSDWTHEMLVDSFWHDLEAMVDHMRGRPPPGPQVTVRNPSLKPRLIGWEAKDIIDLVSSSGQCKARELRLHHEAAGWLHFAEEIGAVVLLAETFGDLVVPTSLQQGICQRSKLVPHGRDYLTIPLYALPIDDRRLRRSTNHSNGCIQLNDKTYWHSFEPGVDTCQCAKGRHCPTVSRFQHSPKARDSSQLPPVNIFKKFRDGAIVIGGTEVLHDAEVDLSISSKTRWAGRLRRSMFRFSATTNR